MHVSLAMVFALGLVPLGCSPPIHQADSSGSAEPAPWTVLIYGGVDSSAEGHIMPHLRSLASLSRQGQSGQVLLLIDRAPGHSKDARTLGENFEDTRLFQLKDGKWNRVSGGAAFPEITLQSNFEANSGDAHTLRKFINFGKELAPAERVALIMFGHGDCRSVCPDITSARPDHDEMDDPLYVGEMTDVLSEAQSVDLIWFDVCSFGAIENAYQFRPGTGRFSAQAIMATPPISNPAPMGDILKKAGILGRPAPDKKLPADGVSFGTLALRVIEKGFWKSNLFDGGRESWGCYDLTAAGAVKLSMDRLAIALANGDNKNAAERVRGVGDTPLTMNYMHTRKPKPRPWVVSPYFDLYDLARRFYESTDMGPAVQTAAKDVMEAVDRFVVASIGGKRYKGFEDGKNGVFIVFPDGDAIWKDKSHWARFQWYHPDDRRGNRYQFGKYAWCADGAKRENGVVENWFELMDSWYDTNNDEGGVNNYRW